MGFPIWSPPGTRACALLVLGGLLAVGCGQTQSPAAAFKAGRIDGVESLVLPPTPSGFLPDQSYYAIGSDPEGYIYVAASDHLTNSVLYLCTPAEGVCRYAGDAKSASQAAGYWNTTETAQKFHTRPTYWNGKIYVATMDYSDIDPTYATRGSRLHIYSYERASGQFVDMTATDPNRTSLDSVNVVVLTADAKRQRIWGMSVQEGRLLEYDPSANSTTRRGRPAEVTGLVDPGRFMFFDAASTLHFSYSGLGRVFRYDPDSDAFTQTDWPVAGQLKCGVYTADRTRLYLSDAADQLYSFEPASGVWTQMGRMATAPASFKNLNISADDRYLYAVESSVSAGLFEYEIAGRSWRFIANLQDAIGSSGEYATGYDSRDGSGNFYYTLNAEGKECTLARVNPTRLKAALGIR